MERKTLKKDIAILIAESVFNKLSANIRECVRIATLGANNASKVDRITDILTECVGT